MASSRNINREIHLIIDVIDYKMFKGKISGQYVICTPYMTANAIVNSSV